MTPLAVMHYIGASTFFGCSHCKIHSYAAGPQKREWKSELYFRLCVVVGLLYVETLLDCDVHRVPWASPPRHTK
jgi:hypothetical protein